MIKSFILFLSICHHVVASEPWAIQEKPSTWTIQKKESASSESSSGSDSDSYSSSSDLDMDKHDPLSDAKEPDIEANRPRAAETVTTQLATESKVAKWLQDQDNVELLSICLCVSLFIGGIIICSPVIAATLATVTVAGLGTLGLAISCFPITCCLLYVLYSCWK